MMMMEIRRWKVSRGGLYIYGETEDIAACRELTSLSQYRAEQVTLWKISQLSALPTVTAGNFANFSVTMSDFGFRECCQLFNHS